MKPLKSVLATALLLSIATATAATFPLAPTGQGACYDTHGGVIDCVARGVPLSGQDAAFAKASLRYRDNGDGTVTDLNTGLIWQQALGPKVSWQEASAGAAQFNLGGYTDWRLPNIKELYSLMDFSGVTPTPARDGQPFISTVFEFHYGDSAAGERPIDVQIWSATAYSGYTMGGDVSVFGVNFADGRIKAYPQALPGRGEHRMLARYVRGNTNYGQNQFVDNRDGTISDEATGLMWMQADSGTLHVGPRGDGTLDWAQALTWAGSLSYAGYRDWRLPNAKELQSIVDYRRSPQATGSAAIDPLFGVGMIHDEADRSAPGFYWSSTTHLDGRQAGSVAVYVAFGEALGFMHMPRSGGQAVLLDVHGAGAQRSDPKVGDPADYPQGMGPQGDVRRIYNLVRLVRSGVASAEKP